MPGAVLAAVGSVVGAVHAAWVHGGARLAAGDGPAAPGPRPCRGADVRGSRGGRGHTQQTQTLFGAPPPLADAAGLQDRLRERGAG